MSHVQEAPVIRALSEEVINRIAAGEVIQRPSSALKELLENSIDSNATQISITIKQGGFQLLQVQDNGHGIRQEDLPVLCKRHTTSKICAFQDLAKIRTLGFRGEALCSISFVAKLRVVTRVKTRTHGFIAEFENSEILSEGVKPCAANPGTIITVEELFLKDQVRRSTARSSSEEFGKILDVLQRYAVHSSSIGFSLKRSGHRQLDLSIPQSCPQLDRISMIYGLSLAEALLEFQGESGPQLSENLDQPSFRFRGFVSQVEFEGTQRGGVFVLFINHRSVECGVIKRAIDAIYASILSKATKSFVYLAIELPTTHVDVNIHPTKHEVEFLFKEELIQSLTEVLKGVLSSSDRARSFTQMKLTQLNNPVISKSLQEQDCVLTSRQEQDCVSKSLQEQDCVLSTVGIEKTRAPDYRLVRTDCKQQDLQSCLLDHRGSDFRFPKRLRRQSASMIQSLSTELTPSSPVQDPLQQELKSVQNTIKESVHEELRTIIKDHSFIGMVAQTHAFIQFQTKLFLIDLEPLSKDFLFWILIQSIRKLSKLPMEESEQIIDILKAQDHDLEATELQKRVRTLVLQKSDLGRFFSIEISETGSLLGLPCVLESYIPDMDYLPSFLMKLSELMKDWTKTLSQITSILECIAWFYSIKNSIRAEDRRHNEWTVKHLILPAMRGSYLPPQSRYSDGSFIKVTSVEELYRRFGRC